MLPRENRLRDPRDFALLRKRGERYRDPLLLLSVMPNGLAVSRFGFVVSGRVGGAVTRNRVKRRLRAIIHTRLTRITTGVDVVVVAHPPMAQASFAQIEAALERLLTSAGLLTDEHEIHSQAH